MGDAAEPFSPSPVDPSASLLELDPVRGAHQWSRALTHLRGVELVAEHALDLHVALQPGPAHLRDGGQHLEGEGDAVCAAVPVCA